MAEYIERKDAIKEIFEMYEREFPTASGVLDEFATRLVPQTLKNLPAADVTPVVHGRWIRTVPHDRESSVMCSVCGETFDYIDGVCHLVRKNVLPPYCPACGAKMDGDKEAT